MDIRIQPPELADLLTMGGLEVESVEKAGNDAIFELGVTPNRADCLSVIGVAREIAALTGKQLHIPKAKPLKGRGRMADFIRVAVKAAKGCPRYSARVVDCIRIGPSPSWMVERLAACDIRSINNVVDATNYVMLKTGQPFHAFDHRLLRGGKIIVSNAKKPFEFTTLDEEKRSVMTQDLLICDGLGAIALAGIMGGKNSEVTDATRTIVLESAYFEPIGIRRTGKRLGLMSESSRRFERGVDPNGTVNALNYLAGLICEIAGGTPTTDSIDVKSHVFPPLKIRLEAAEVKRILGIDIPLREMTSIVSRLGMTVVSQSGGAITLKVPTYRPDITRPIDVIEEVARIYGYHRIQETMPRAVIRPIVKPRFTSGEQRVRNALIGCGFSEAVMMGFGSRGDHESFSYLAPAPIEISNPISKEEDIMRTTLIPGLLKVFAVNVSRQRYDVRLFTLGHVFHRFAAGNTEEPLYLAGLLAGKRNIRSWDGSREMTDFYDAKGAVEAILRSMNLENQALWQKADGHPFLHPGRAAHILVDNKRIGFVGQIHPNFEKCSEIDSACFVFEMDFGALAQLSLALRPQFSELSRFPFVERDLAVIVDEAITSAEILRVIQNSGVSLVSDVQIFDVYRGKGIGSGKKSMAYRIRYASSERTLTDDEVNAAHESIVKTLEKTLGAVLRT